MRVALVADTHGFIDPRVVEAVAGCELVVHAGDVGSTDVLEALAGDGAEVIAVRGNNDVPAKWIGSKQELRGLRDDAVIELPGGVLVVVHGDRVGGPVLERHDRLRAAFEDARAIVYGHSHHRVIDKQTRPWVINPGAAGRARTFGGPSLCLLTATERRWTIRERVFQPVSRRR